MRLPIMHRTASDDFCQTLGEDDWTRGTLPLVVPPLNDVWADCAQTIASPKSLVQRLVAFGVPALAVLCFIGCVDLIQATVPWASWAHRCLEGQKREGAILVQQRCQWSAARAGVAWVFRVHDARNAYLSMKHTTWPCRQQTKWH